MSIVWVVLLALVGYLFGSVPMGFILVRLTSGQDIRQLGSGRTGSTNVMRAGGGRIALLTGVLDVLKAAAAVWLAQRVLPENHLAEVAAGISAIVGHIYSIFIGFKGGAGGAPTIGAALALWPWSVLAVVPIGAAVWYFIGYASVATISFSLTIIAVMIFRWLRLDGPWEHIAYGIIALLVCLWALRPNLRRLVHGQERLIGWRARRLKQAGAGDSASKGT